jgi:RimJ/RimL family protein N-acetyltransferase
LKSSGFMGKVVLREVTENDLPIFFQQQLDPEANQMAAFTARDPADRNAFNAHWNKILADETVMPRTILLDGHVAGSVASWVDTKWLGKPEVTYWIGKEYWGKGLATKALSEFLKIQKTRPLYARAARDNIASLRVLEKCGFKIFGYDKSLAFARGTEVEEALLELK